MRVLKYYVQQGVAGQLYMLYVCWYVLSNSSMIAI